MGIRRSILKRIGRSARDERREAAWRHTKWPSRQVESFLVSFPKSGRTWLRVLIGAAEAHRLGTSVESEVSRWLAQTAPMLDDAPVLFTHALGEDASESPESLRLFQGYIGQRRRAFLVRDPRDVVVSYYFQRVKRRTPTADIPLELPDFIRHPGYGIDRVLQFLQVCDAAVREHSGPALVISYEGLHRDPVASLDRVLRFFGRPTSGRALEAAVDYGRFENMRRLETGGVLAKSNKRLRSIDPNDETTFKTRKGKVGGYTESLSQDDVRYIEERIAALLPADFGYTEPGVGPKLAET